MIRSTYKEKLDQWKDNCYIKPGDYYDADEIRDKFGRYSQTIYDEKHNELYYKYTKRWLFDDWNIYDNYGKAIFNYIETSEHYYNTTKPPQRPTTNYEYKNSKVIKITNYNSNKTIDFVNEFNENKKLVKQTHYQPDGKTIKQINEYTDNEKLIKITHYYPDGQNIDSINEYNKNEKLIKKTYYRGDGRTIDYINEYNENGQEIKTTHYQNDGQTINCITEYNPDGTIKE
ncbi:DUF2963 domain-containing protein [Candidatus Phytoplasma sp. AldY-WA1]|uniref:DUF2963 domain-containing protein n=1 Tax=Candidatus Phytoplasma sp. AldY-WA1 TaxID=2852100 RepID=UPI0025504BD9|nr:DUF2963 domain-containing protein [Candidatus Phytoplasma sp. AldY-WA1]